MTASLAGHRFASPRDAALHHIAKSLQDRWRKGGQIDSPVGEFAAMHINLSEAANLALACGIPAALVGDLVGSWVVTETIKLREDGSVLIPATVFVGAFDRPHKADDEWDRLAGKYQQWVAAEAEKAKAAAEMAAASS